MTIDGDALRRDLMDYYGTAMAGGFPMAALDVNRIKNATIEELVQMAVKNNVDLSRYEA